jgi:hypothetical protein
MPETVAHDVITNFRICGLNANLLKLLALRLFFSTRQFDRYQKDMQVGGYVSPKL